MSLARIEKARIEKAANWLDAERSRLLSLGPGQVCFQENWLVVSIVLRTLYDVLNMEKQEAQASKVVSQTVQHMVATSGYNVARWRAARAQVRAEQVLGLVA